MVLQVEKLGDQLKVQGTSTQRALDDKIQTLEKYVNAMHSEQIEQFEKLKKMTAEGVTGKEFAQKFNKETKSRGNDEQVVTERTSIGTAKNWLEDELHPACAKDYLLLCNE